MSDTPEQRAAAVAALFDKMMDTNQRLRARHRDQMAFIVHSGGGDRLTVDAVNQGGTETYHIGEIQLGGRFTATMLYAVAIVALGLGVLIGRLWR